MAGALVGEDVRGERLDRIRRGHVGQDAPNRARVGELFERDLQHGLLHVGDDDACPVLEEGLDDAAPDAGRSSGDHGNLAVQIVHTRAPVFLTPRQTPTITPGETAPCLGAGLVAPESVRRSDRAVVSLEQRYVVRPL